MSVNKYKYNYILCHVKIMWESAYSMGNELPVRNGMKLQGQNYWFFDHLQVNFILIEIIPYIIITVSHINQQMPVTVLQIL